MVARRVVVSGVGLLCSTGSGTEETWKAIRNGVSGIGPIKQFDASDYASRIAGEVRDFDPLLYIEKKEIKKMGRFIQFAVAASEFAVKSAQIQFPAEEAERGVRYADGRGWICGHAGFVDAQ